MEQHVYMPYDMYVIKSVPITTNVVSSNPDHGEVYWIHHYVIKIFTDLRQVGVFSPCSPVSSTDKTDRHNLTEIFLNNPVRQNYLAKQRLVLAILLTLNKNQ